MSIAYDVVYIWYVLHMSITYDVVCIWYMFYICLLHMMFTSDGVVKKCVA